MTSAPTLSSRLPGTMLAVRLHAWSEQPVIEDIPVPAPALGETLVRMRAAAVAHVDRSIASGTFAQPPPLPHIGGVEGVGDVVCSDALEVGTRVLVRGAGVGLARPGCWSEYAVVPDRALTPVPADLNAPLAAAFFVPCTTAFVAVNDVGKLSAGEHVIVIGAAGSVGSLIAQTAIRAGAGQVTGVILREADAPLVPIGADVTILPSVAERREFASTTRADLLIDTLGGPGLSDLLAAVKPGGRAVLIGYVTGEELTVSLPQWLLSEVSLLPVNMMRRERRARELAPSLAASVADGTLRVTVQEFSLQQAGEALDRLVSGSVSGRAVLMFSDVPGSGTDRQSA